METTPLPPVALVLDNLRSIYNTAAITRSAAFFGVARIHACGTTPLPDDRFGRKRADFAKVALGAEELVSFVSHPSTEEALVKLRSNGWYIACLEQAPNAIPLEQGVRGDRFPLAIVVGEERRGIAPHILSLSDAIWEIPRKGQKESLNVAVAAGIALWAVRSLPNLNSAAKPPRCLSRQ